ncbi:hypothetical protein, partial [Prevotella sp. HMSC073D09]|uniref:hypothetical protein n=1 Tax=Prevotella sp. HMSC073D09 TaxID=1739459 RepID=UPI001AEF5188
RLTPSTYNEENLKRTSLCFFCSYVGMDVFRSPYEGMSDYPAHLFPRQLVNLSTRQPTKLCQFISKNFNTMSALFAANRSPCRKKSILAKVVLCKKGVVVHAGKMNFYLN